MRFPEQIHRIGHYKSSPKMQQGPVGLREFVAKRLENARERNRFYLQSTATGGFPHRWWKSRENARRISRLSKNPCQGAQVLAFPDRLEAAVVRCQNPVLVGLDPRAEMLPPGLLAAQDRSQPEKVAAAYRQFCREIIDVVAHRVPAVKPQAAFFEELGPPGMMALAATIRYAQEQGLIVVLDGKRNDIGSTATAYAHGYLGRETPWGADALTVSPYLGDDSLEPFVEVAAERMAGLFVLVKTSNPGGRMIQDLVADGQPIYRHVAEFVERLAVQTEGDNEYGAVGAVVGATYPRNSRSCGRRCRTPGFWCPASAARAARRPTWPRPSIRRAGGRSSTIPAASSSPTRSSPIRSDSPPASGKQAVEAATSDMIAQLRAETPAGKL